MNRKLHAVSLYILCLGALVFIYGLKTIHLIAYSDEIVNFLDFIEWPFYIILIILIFLKKMYRIRELLGLVSLGGVLLFIYFYSGYAALFKAFVVIVSAKGLASGLIIRTMRNIYGCILALSFLLFITGWSDAGLQRRGYQTYGFITVNVCGGILFILCLLTLLNERKRKKKILISYFFCLTIFLITDNRSVSALLFIAPIIEACFTKILSKDKKLLYRWGMYFIPVFGIGLSLITAEAYPISSFLQKLNVILNSRIYLNYFNLHQFGIHLFAQNVHFVSGANIFNAVTGTYSTFNTVDNAYMCLLLQMGAVAAGIYVIGHMILCKRLIDDNDSALLTIIFLLGIYGMFESSILNIYINIPFLFLLTQRRMISDITLKTGRKGDCYVS